MTDITEWVGKSQEQVDTAWQLTADRIAGLLDRDVLNTGETWPAAWVWSLFGHSVRHDQVGPDGHPARGGFLPPVALPRRMWASSHVEVHQGIQTGERLKRVSTIKDVTEKDGRSGRLCFVIVDHEITGEKGAKLHDRHTIVYRGIEEKQEQQNPRTGEEIGFAPQWKTRVQPDPVMLFQYSAVTYNTHRIHYDDPYVREKEGYPGLVIHGPLTATLLLETVPANIKAARVKSFSMRARRPLFVPEAYDLAGRVDGKSFRLAAINAQNRIAMEIEGELA
ncbi:FAS1-like dehydratase domain-containing protein [Limoniibacter endophyticus]|uniref:FAS1-like dehydratase domain-containing protein n=1 Tax=Limoniibacter endophyticus TaxID=1565040 RepID=A0A8J3DJE2_9HYPH|nr:MaoC family dehydratase N-terminal domain-containing protein [Limoniibacter endophyticus]GHC78170.1 hypothetical protein GCM10010136_29890 [Limoniibacter endophyticus]